MKVQPGDQQQRGSQWLRHKQGQEEIYSFFNDRTRLSQELRFLEEGGSQSER